MCVYVCMIMCMCVRLYVCDVICTYVYACGCNFRFIPYSVIGLYFNWCRYWTDNGACYYYTTDKFSNYEEALVAVKEQADKEGIPYRYLQVTS